jgi:NarL family two-component system response regulator LiaR
MKIKLLLVDDHALVREGLRAVLAQDRGIEIVGEAGDGGQAVNMVRQHQPDVVLLDLLLPGANGIDATRQILAEFPRTKVIILSSVQEFFKVQICLEAGAFDYLVKTTPAEELLQTIRRAYKSESRSELDNPEAQLMRVKELAGPEPVLGEGENDLTHRELQVLCLIASGYGNKQIGSELGISHKTVEKHRQRLMNKLKIHDVPGLTRYALSTGIVQQQPQVASVAG